MKGEPVRRIDVHTHFAPRDLDGIGGIRLDGDTVVHPEGFRWPLHRSFYDVEARLAAMDELGIDLAVMSIAPPLFLYWLDDTSASVDFCRRANDDLAAFARDSGGRIEAVATLPMRDPAAAVAELHRAVGTLGMRGAEIGPRVEDTYLDDPLLRPILAAAAELDVPLILHPYHVGPRPGLAEYYLSNLVGNPLESTAGSAHLIFGGVLDELETLRPVLMHGGGYLPYQIGRLDHGHRVRAESAGCKHPPSSYLRRFWYDTITHAPGPLRFLLDTVGADRVVYGTDFPYDMAAGPLDDQLAGIELDAADRARIAGENAAGLFGLAEQP
jgi:aminocarboxymuconate-semialdehyde decarboxylase